MAILSSKKHVHRRHGKMSKDDTKRGITAYPSDGKK